MTEVIRLDNVSKRFIIHHQKHRSFQDVVVNLFRNSGSREEFWALKDISFSVRKGETVGLIGQNGSGKSTALKLISRIIEPTSGKIAVNGSISSLLELGAGFHPELTGRDNVFLNGSLLGFSKRKMEDKFDEIVDFAELWQFIDTPVKHYSSGMYMRLAFAVAINVDPDILLVDEVLAVGDKAFQDKCLEKINDFQVRGKTILFVSHSLETVKNICTRVVWLDHGRIRSTGESRRVVFEYLREVEAHEEAVEKAELQVGPAPQTGTQGVVSGVGSIQIRDLKILGKERTEKRVFRTGDDLTILLHYVVRDQHSLQQDCTFAISINDVNGTLIHRALSHIAAEQIKVDQPGVVELKYEDIPLLEGMYTISVAVWQTDSPDSPFDVHHQRYRFSVEGGAEIRDALEDGLISLRHVWAHDVGLPGELVGDTVRTEYATLKEGPSFNGHGEFSVGPLPPTSDGENLSST